METQNKLFSPHHQTTPSESLNHRPASPVLDEYKWVGLRPLCVCSTILCICFLSFPHHFCHVSFCCVSLLFVLIFHKVKGIDFLACIIFSYFLKLTGPFSLLLCLWACWLLFPTTLAHGVFTSLIGLSWPIYFTFYLLLYPWTCWLLLLPR